MQLSLKVENKLTAFFKKKIPKKLLVSDKVNVALIKAQELSVRYREQLGQLE